MNFVPAAADRVLHDTWIYLDGDDIHLFYLAPSVAKPSHRLIGHALSRNWVDWEELESIELTGPAGAWDSGRVGTGYVYRHDDGRFYMAYTGRIDPQEDIGLAASDDLVTWTKLADAPLWPVPEVPPYETADAAPGPRRDWRDPFVVRNPQGQWEAFVCARQQAGPPPARACLGRARLRDASQWETLPPFAHTGAYAMMEVPEVFTFAGKCWVTFNSHSLAGRRLDTPRRRVAGGTFYLVADEWDGPWRVPQDNLLIGSGAGRMDAVVARSVVWRGTRLVYHHYNGTVAADSDRAFGLPKVMTADGDRLTLHAWDGVDQIWHEPIPLDGWRVPARGPLSGGTWEVNGGRVRGRSDVGAAACLLGAAPDLDVEFTVTLHHGTRAGIAVGLHEPGTRGIVVLLDALRGETTIGRCRQYASTGPYLDDTFDVVTEPVARDRPCALRLMVRDRYAEVFRDGELVFSTVVGERAGSHLACVVDEAEATVEFQRVHRLRPLVR